MQKWIICFFLCTSVLFGVEARLKERIEKAKTGDYVVVEAGKTVTLLAIRANNGSTLIFEEISAPLQNLKKLPTSWSDWIKAKAPGHTSWSMTELDLKTGQILECYSYSRSSWVKLSQQESLFASLLLLPMKAVPQKELRRIGPPPLDGEADHRKVWIPPLVFEGNKIENVSFEAFGVTWPQDGSELANKDAILYFDKEKRSPLPFWIQIETSHLTAALKTVDSGKNLASIYRSLPRRVPEFIGMPQHTKNGLKLTLKSPKYYRQFELFAVDVTNKQKQLCPINHSLTEINEELLTVEIDREELEENLQADHRYTWLIVPAGHSESYTQSTKPFAWNSKE